MIRNISRHHLHTVLIVQRLIYFRHTIHSLALTHRCRQSLPKKILLLSRLLTLRAVPLGKLGRGFKLLILQVKLREERMLDNNVSLIELL